MHKKETSTFLFESEDKKTKIILIVDYLREKFNIIPFNRQKHFWFINQNKDISRARDVALLILEATSFAELELTFNDVLK